MTRENELSFSNSLTIQKLKPEFVIHGDDWISGKQAVLRKNVIETLNKYGGKLIEVPYTKGISSEAISNKSKKVGISPDQRIKTLKRLESQRCRKREET